MWMHTALALQAVMGPQPAVVTLVVQEFIQLGLTLLKVSGHQMLHRQVLLPASTVPYHQIQAYGSNITKKMQWMVCTALNW